MESIAIVTFKTQIVREYSITPVLEPLGNLESTMELFHCNNDTYRIEWDIPSIDECEWIGIFCYEGTKVVRDYDGVFALNDFAKQLLKENGFDCDEV